MSSDPNGKSVSRRMAVLYSIAWACIGLIIGSGVGGMLIQSVYSPMVSMLIADRTLERYVDAMHLLKLIDDGKNDSLKQALLMKVQDDTTLAVSLLKGMPETTRGPLRRYVGFSGTLKSVQADTSELGQAAAEARKDPIVAAEEPSPKN